MTIDSRDRHVLAAAVRANAEVLVTFNTRDFPEPALKPYDIAGDSDEWDGPGAEPRVRAFYGGVLGMTELDNLPGHRRFYAHDPLGSRLEFLEPESAA